MGHLTRKVGYFGLGGRKSEFLRRYPKMTFLLKSWILTIWGFQCVVNPIFSETLSVRNRLINPKLPKSCKNQIKFQVVLIWLRSLKSRFLGFKVKPFGFWAKIEISILMSYISPNQFISVEYRLVSKF